MSYAARRLDAAFLRAYRAEALTDQGGFCRYCFVPLPRREATTEHREPRKHGGSNARHNIAASCFDCNHAKGGMPEKLFVALISAVRLPHTHLNIQIVWAARRMFKAMHRHHRRLMAAVGGAYHGPKGMAA